MPTSTPAQLLTAGAVDVDLAAGLEEIERGKP